MLGLAVVLLFLPLPASLMGPLAGLMLVLQVGLLVMALAARPPASLELEIISLAQDAVLLMAVAVTRATWAEGNPFPVPEVGAVGILLGVALNGLYLHWMLHHSMAHRKMARLYDQQLDERLAAVAADLESRILDQQEADRKNQQFSEDQRGLEAICALGQQAGGMAILQLGCLAVAGVFDSSGGLWLGWVLAVSLPGLINSKAQDMLLNDYLPRESRLC